MSDNDEQGHLDTIYSEGAEWIRMCNHITWAVGTIMVPVSLTALPIALEKPHYRFFLAPASIFLFLFWVYVSKLYRASAAITRSVLMNIEEEWQIKEEFSPFRKHGQVGSNRYGLHHTQLACVVVLVILWIVLLIWLPKMK